MDLICKFFFELYGQPLDLTGLTHSVPTRRSSDLRAHRRCRPRHAAAQLRRAEFPGDARAPYTGPSACTPVPVASTHTPIGSPHGREPRPGASAGPVAVQPRGNRSEEHTSELQSLMRNSYAVFCLKKKTNKP